MLPNINIGLMGHVDSGKTSLAKAISLVSSTAAFDKNPQSQERGITLDLGFSAAVVESNERLKEIFGGDCEKVQLTFVDCPGHASLIRTVMGGAHIIDLVILVVDIVKGFQTQTAECLLIAEMFCPQLIVVLNKVDLLPQNERSTKIEKMKQRVRKMLEDTKFTDAPIISSSAASSEPNVKEVLSTVLNIVKPRSANQSAADLFLAAVDHCFQVRGHGTVLTGTVLSGKVSVGDSIELVPQGLVKKVKSMQVFRQPVQNAKQGDRVGICVAGLDSDLVERALIATPGKMNRCYAAIVDIKRIKYYKGDLVSKSRLHVTVAYETTLAVLTLFSVDQVNKQFEIENEYLFESEYPAPANDPDESSKKKSWFALLEFERPLVFPPNALVIGAKLDTDVETRQCRLAFTAQVVHPFTDNNYRQSNLQQLKVYREKSKEGFIERAQDRHNVVVRNLFKKDTNIQNFEGMKVSLSTGEKAVIEGAFGHSGKVKLHIPG